MSKKEMFNFNAMSTKKLALIGVLCFIIVISLIVALGAYSPEILGGAFLAFMVALFLWAIYEFCYVVIEEYR